MDGVTIIAEHVVEDYGAGWSAVVMSAGVVALMMLVLLIRRVTECRGVGFDHKDVTVIVAISLIFLACCGVCVFSAKRVADDSTHVEYTVTLDESAGYLEFTERYEVLDEEDGAYRVREKEG